VRSFSRRDYWGQAQVLSFTDLFQSHNAAFPVIDCTDLHIGSTERGASFVGTEKICNMRVARRISTIGYSATEAESNSEHPTSQFTTVAVNVASQWPGCSKKRRQISVRALTLALLHFFDCSF
jgi:hypothetical protein